MYARMGDLAAKVTAALGAAAEPVKPTTPTAPSIIKKGDVVRILSGATYYSGKAVPNWVAAKQWIVREVSGDRAVIDKSVDGKNAICARSTSSSCPSWAGRLHRRPALARTA